MDLIKAATIGFFGFVFFWLGLCAACFFISDMINWLGFGLGLLACLPITVAAVYLVYKVYEKYD